LPISWWQSVVRKYPQRLGGTESRKPKAYR
jgi:hypothetical protein